ncbi:MAG: hypothetical protein ACLQSR_14015 [Limisphaerales bacterium]
MKIKRGFLMLVLCVGIQLHAQTLTTLAYFTGTNGSEPSAMSTLGGDGNIYGTTRGAATLISMVITAAAWGRCSN